MYVLAQICGPPGMMEHISGDKAKDYSQGEVLMNFLSLKSLMFRRLKFAKTNRHGILNESPSLAYRHLMLCEPFHLDHISYGIVVACDLRITCGVNQSWHKKHRRDGS